MQFKNEIVKIDFPLPIERFGRLKRLWIKFQAMGLFRIARLSANGRFEIDAYRVLQAIDGKPFFRVTLSYQGHASAGSSTVSIVTALQKAFGELIENQEIFGEHHILGETRSGFASDMLEEIAKLRAYRELIERDSLITHVLCSEVKSTPLSKPDYAVLPVKVASLWSADDTIHVVLCGYQPGPDAPYFLGAGAEANHESALEKAYMECVTTYCGFANTLVRTVESARHNEIVKHVHASRELPMKGKLDAIFNGLGSVTPEFETSSASAAFKICDRPSPKPVLVKAEHSSLCKLTFGRILQESQVDIISQLRSRRLSPIWSIHPFA